MAVVGCSRRAPTPAGVAVDGAAGPPSPTADGRVPAPLDARRDGAALTCAASGGSDGEIQFEELRFITGVTTTYLVGSKGVGGPGPLLVDLQGTLQSSGRRRWDLTAAAADDHTVKETLDAVAPPWSTIFPTATFSTTSVSEGNGGRLFYSATPAALALLGATGESLTTLDAPLELLRFPVRLGDSFTSQAVESSSPPALPMVTQIKVQVEVIAAGDLKLPHGLTLPVLQVKTTRSVTASGLSTGITQESFTFLAECFGVVAELAVVGPYSSLASVPVSRRVLSL